MDNDFGAMFKETAPAPSFSLIDEGEYEAEITDTSLDLEKSPPRLTVVYQITSDERYHGRKLFGNYQLGGQGISFLKKDLELLGLDYSNVGSPEDIMDLMATALNTPVNIFVNQKEWQGKTYNNVYLNGIVDAPAATAPAPLNRKEQERRETKAPPMAATKSGGKKSPPPATKKGKGTLDDDVPF